MDASPVCASMKTCNLMLDEGTPVIATLGVQLLVIAPRFGRKSVSSDDMSPDVGTSNIA
ncbi:hypothetical protein H5410_012449 [Solanum commersonii]|uniref:Uncharacterized protein n=1 Tax=Solanum commersonii TaxID=4109 RepID=A0A9J6ASV8_SOLCO|nr:hypothetical protein H5410_012449 [Solanum commersonii]